MDDNGDLFSALACTKLGYGEPPSFTNTILQNQGKADVQNVEFGGGTGSS